MSEKKKYITFEISFQCLIYFEGFDWAVPFVIWYVFVVTLSPSWVFSVTSVVPSGLVIVVFVTVTFLPFLMKKMF